MLQKWYAENKRIVVPKASRKEFLNVLHVSHRGAVLPKLKRYNLVTDPAETEKVKSLCQDARFVKKTKKETLINKDIPNRPEQKVACDFFLLKRKTYLYLKLSCM